MIEQEKTLDIVNTNSIDRDDLDCFHRILYQEQDCSFENKKILIIMLEMCDFTIM